MTVYAKRHCPPVASLYYWRQKLLAVDGEEAPPSGACTLIFPSGLRLEMPAPAWLAALEQSHAGTR